MLLNPDAAGVAIEKLRYSGEDVFYHEPHKAVYNALVALFTKSTPIDLVTVMDALVAAGTLSEAGGVIYLMDLAKAVPTSANVEYYAGIVLNCAILRKAIQQAAMLASQAYAGETPSTDLLAKHQIEINKLADTQTAIQIVSAFTAAQELTSEVSAMIEAGQHMRGVEVGISGLDAVLYGLQRENLVVIAARPGVGKTALMLYMAAHIAIDLKIPVLLFSKEMSRDELIMRVMQMRGDIQKDRIMTGWQARGEIPKMQNTAAALDGVPLYIVDEAQLTILDVKTISRRFQAKHNVKHGVVAIDYLQILDPVDRKAQRQEQVAEMSRESKQLAKELGWTVIALSQLNRKGDETDKQRPRLSHLRESGAIEQDANVVMLLHEEKHDSETMTHISLEVAKNRGGKRGLVNLTYNKANQTFYMRDDRAQPPPQTHSYQAATNIEQDYEDEMAF
jgi:replicative DNA helicase